MFNIQRRKRKIVMDFVFHKLFKVMPILKTSLSDLRTQQYVVRFQTADACLKFCKRTVTMFIY